MRSYLSHAAMLLLGVTLSVGFYEGRQLVKNTARALGASPTVSTPARPGETEALRARLAEAEEKLAARRANRAERAEERPRRRARAGEARELDSIAPGGVRPSSRSGAPSIPPIGARSRAERLPLARDGRSRVGEHAAPLVRPAPSVALPKVEQVGVAEPDGRGDTGLVP